MLEKLSAEIKKAIDEQYGNGYEVQFYETMTPSGCPIPSIAICAPSENICPAIHIGQLLSPMRCGLMEPEDAAAEFMDLYNRIIDISQYAQCLPHIDHNYVTGTVTYRLVNTEKEASRLTRLPHKELLDLSAVYTVPIDIGKSKDEYIIVDNTLCERLSIGPDELQESAELHTEYKGFRITPYTPCPSAEPHAESDSSSLWVLTSKNGANGATVLLYPYYLRRLSGRLKKDLYLVASSKDRVIAAPAEKGTDLPTLRDMADRINFAYEPGPGKFLTDSIYRFSRRKDRLKIAKQKAPIRDCTERK